MWGETICSSIQQAPKKIEQIEFAAILSGSSYNIYIGLLTKKDSTQSQIPCMENMDNNYQTRTIIFLCICSKKRGLQPGVKDLSLVHRILASWIERVTWQTWHDQANIVFPNQKDRQTKILRLFGYRKLTTSSNRWCFCGLPKIDHVYGPFGYLGVYLSYLDVLIIFFSTMGNPLLGESKKAIVFFSCSWSKSKLRK